MKQTKLNPPYRSIIFFTTLSQHGLDWGTMLDSGGRTPPSPNLGRHLLVSPPTPGLHQAVRLRNLDPAKWSIVNWGASWRGQVNAAHGLHIGSQHREKFVCAFQRSWARVWATLGLQAFSIFQSCKPACLGRLTFRVTDPNNYQGPRLATEILSIPQQSDQIRKSSIIHRLHRLLCECA
ncbi:uncharacterized protein BDR25DRAFT_348020 [Lindgomyces ingoldianus]|uniref:Uncharacterized protein n=1 Tax=Lindgomyces ingoldianus TaxID=673940 RepID=A0ACB6REK6_9PLEO|nr:uncharacterized protein BDR25DRAFT_348020 [Lindgomyces ingoldianus]KAF2477699.1 hypothetical protein BDR25DRAFT_348020 [Lindgomyces ingoldianus]